jgi:hypothetical protein
MNIPFWLIHISTYLSLNTFANRFYNPFSIKKQYAYNYFADKRCKTICNCKIANFNDVFSNVIYLLGGLFQLYKTNYSIGISGILVSIGSAYYHLNPNMITLFFDRLPMQIAFLSIIFKKIVFDTSIEHIGVWLLTFGSLFNWVYNYNLIPYAAFQLSMIIYWLFMDNTMLVEVTLYILAKICEDNDMQIYKITNNNISGHTIKHLVSGCALFFI